MSDPPLPTEPGTADRRITDLLEVLAVSRQLAATSELQPLLELIEQSALRVLGCERASVFLYDGAAGELFSRVATGGQPVRFPATAGIAGETFRTAAVIRVADAYADSRFNPAVDRRTGFHTRTILSCPLRGWDNSVLGVLQVLNKRAGPFDTWDEELARTLSAQAGVAVQRQRLLEEFATKQRIERDLAIAREIQQGLLPHQPPRVPGFDVAGWNRPADETGGDVYDFQALPAGAWAVSLADVTGHGIGPALVATECRALLRAGFPQAAGLAAFAGQVNRLLSADLPEGCFVTAFLGRLHPAGRLEYISAGHGPVLVFRAATAGFEVLPVQGLPLGVEPDLPCGEPCDVPLGAGDLAAVFTDGFFEWRNAAGGQFGLARLQARIRADHRLPAAELIQAVYRDVEAFAGGTPQRDDLTAVVVKRL